MQYTLILSFQSSYLNIFLIDESLSSAWIINMYVTNGFCLVPVNAEYLKLHQLWERYSEVLCCTIVYSETGVGHYIVSSPLFSVQPQMLVSPVSDCWSTQYLINNSKNTSFSDIWWQNMTSTGDYNNYRDIWALKGFGWSIL